MPKSTLAAELELARTVVAPGDRFAYAIVNTGSVAILFGAAYELERLIDDGWDEVSVPWAFRAWGRVLQPGKRWELTAQVPENAPPGRYRLSKPLSRDRDPYPETLHANSLRDGDRIRPTAEFQVRRGRSTQTQRAAGT